MCFKPTSGLSFRGPAEILCALSRCVCPVTKQGCRKRRSRVPWSCFHVARRWEQQQYPHRWLPCDTRRADRQLAPIVPSALALGVDHMRWRRRGDSREGPARAIPSYSASKARVVGSRAALDHRCWIWLQCTPRLGSIRFIFFFAELNTLGALSLLLVSHAPCLYLVETAFNTHARACSC